MHAILCTEADFADTRPQSMRGDASGGASQIAVQRVLGEPHRAIARSVPTVVGGANAGIG